METACKVGKRVPMRQGSVDALIIELFSRWGRIFFAIGSVDSDFTYLLVLP